MGVVAIVVFGDYWQEQGQVDYINATHCHHQTIPFIKAGSSVNNVKPFVSCEGAKSQLKESKKKNHIFLKRKVSQSGTEP